MKPAIDGDSIIYRCCFAAQKRIYEFDGKEFPYKKDLEEYTDSQDYTFRIEVEPVENALANIKNTLQSIIEGTDAEYYRLYISSNTPTFRDKLATIKPYKGHRIDMEKPVHYDAGRQYLQDYWDAKLVYGIEADDACGIWQSQVEDSVIVSNDKDLLQVPGNHYNWTKDEPTIREIDEDLARFNKYCQILSGDITDNIEGLPGVGDRIAEGYLRDLLGDSASEQEYEERCWDLYEEILTSDKVIKLGHLKGMTYSDYLGLLAMTPNQVYEETKALITILTKEPEFEDFAIR